MKVNLNEKIKLYFSKILLSFLEIKESLGYTYFVYKNNFLSVLVYPQTYFPSPSDRLKY